MIINKSRFIFIIFLLSSFIIGLPAESNGWHVGLSQASKIFCSPETLTMGVLIRHDTTIMDSCKYQWYIKTPIASDYTIVAVDSSVIYEFDTPGTYSVYATAQPDTFPIFITDTISMVVRPQMTVPVILGAKTICFDSIPSLLTIHTLSTVGAGDSITYQWEESLDGQNYSDTLKATSLSYQPGQLTEDHYYRVVATSVKGCGRLESNVVKVEVLPDLTITTTDTTYLCYKKQGSIEVTASGAGDNYTYQWFESNDKLSYTEIAGATDSVYQTEPKEGGYYYYKCEVSPTFGCTPKISDVITVLVYDSLQAGIITGIDTICYDSIPNAITLSIPAIGGEIGEYTYQWQSTTTGIWSDIAAENDTAYQPAALRQTTSYRVIIGNLCDTVVSNEVTVVVRPQMTVPVILGAKTICFDSIPSLLTIHTLSTVGAGDSITYQWEESLDGQNYSDTLKATSLSYQPGQLTEDHYYRVVATSVKGCGRLESNVVKVEVLPDLTITTTDTTYLCYKKQGSIEVTASGAGDNYTYQWFESNDKLSYTEIAGATDSVYQTEPKEGGYYYYKCEVSPTFGCTPKISDVITVLVYDSLQAGIITGIDTICYDSIPNAITLSIPAIGGEIGEYTYQWQSTTTGIWSDIAAENDTAYQPAALRQTTSYRVIIGNLCDTVVSNEVTVVVRPQMTVPVILGAQTICFDSIPPLLTIHTLSTVGAGDSITYQWEESLDGQNYSDTLKATSLSYQPGQLTEDHYYRVVATSVKGCGRLESNVVKVEVLPDLTITTTDTTYLCYKKQGSIEVTASGAGDNYTYQWFESNDKLSYTEIAGATDRVYQTEPKEGGYYYYKCEVSPTFGCTPKISDVITVLVYDSLQAGIITGIDSTCYGFAPDGVISIDQEPKGVDGKYTYQWQMKTDGEWNNINGATSETYQVQPLNESTYYRLMVISICDSDYTNELCVRVNPLPQVQNILGSENVCYNQHEIYSLDKLNDGFTYIWSIENGKGIITTEVENVTTVDVVWSDPNSKDAVMLLVKDNTTGCERVILFNVTICNEEAPDRTVIVRKPNANILVCQEAREMFFEWGYTEKASQNEIPIEDSYRRYVLLPHMFDSNLYDYWLTLRYNSESKCYSRSYYAVENDTVIGVPLEASVLVSSYVLGQISIMVHNPDAEDVECQIYDLAGRLVSTYNLGSLQIINATLPLTTSGGLYIMRVEMGANSKTIKLIAE